MKTIYEIRLENFETLIAEAGSVAELARRCGYNKPAYLYQVRAQVPKANGKTLRLGKRVAANLEQGMDKPAGWMDIDHSQPAAALPKVHAAPVQQAAAAVCSGAVALAVTAASGTPYALHLLGNLLAAGQNVVFSYSDPARAAIERENGLLLSDDVAEAKAQLCSHFNAAHDHLIVLDAYDFIAAESIGFSAAVVCPASSGGIAAAAHGIVDTVPAYFAEAALKHRLPLLLVPHEPALGAVQLENMLKLARLGVHILPVTADFSGQQDMLGSVTANVLACLNAAGA